MIKRIILFFVITEFLYLLLFNAALNIGFTQNIINKLKPEKFQITWQKAWTPYPFKVYIEDGSAWGASSSQQWKVDVHTASASIAVLPLLSHKVKLNDVRGVDVVYTQHRLHEKHALSTKEHETLALSTKHVQMTSDISDEKKHKKKKPWHITVKHAALKGHHRFTIDKLKGDISGDLFADVSIETKGGPFAIRKGKADISINSLEIGEGQSVLQDGKIKGDIEISPIVFKENKGKKIVKFLTFDTDVEAKMGNLDFLNIYLHAIKGMQLEGKGLLKGHLNFDKGVLLAGTKLAIDANTLSLSMLNHTVEGKGLVDLNVSKEKSDKVNVAIVFDELKGYYGETDFKAKQQKRGVPLFSGKGLSVKAAGTPSLFPNAGGSQKISSLNIEIPSVNIEDLGQYQRYVPEKTHFKLYGGEGTLQAHADFSGNNVRSKIQLQAKGAELGMEKSRFKSNLDLLVNFDANTAKRLTIDLSGSYLSLTDSKLSSQNASAKRASKPWNTKLTVNKGTLSVPLPASPKVRKTLSKEEKKINMQSLLEQADGNLEISGSITQLDWINIFLKNSLGLSLQGNSDIEGNVALKNGFLIKGSAFTVKSKALDIHLLDYGFKGDGAFSAKVSKGGMYPDMKFDLSLDHAEMKRQNEKTAMIDSVVMKLDGEMKNLGLKKAKKEFALHLQIPSAKIKDITIYNSYIPKNSPFRLSNGKADMQADIQLSANDAKGYVKLLTKGLTMRVDEQKISARLKMDIKLSGGTPMNMTFNIAGSSIVLDQARVTGSTSTYKTPDWSAQVQLKKANVVWRKPIRLQSETSLQIKDSRPVVAMLDNQKEKHNWLSKLMTIEHIRGTATVNMANNVITFPYAFVKSDKIDIGAKGIISSVLREGMFFLRYKHLKLLLKMKNGKKNIDIFHTKKTFDNYKVKIP